MTRQLELGPVDVISPSGKATNPDCHTVVWEAMLEYTPTKLTIIQNQSVTVIAYL